MKRLIYVGALFGVIALTIVLLSGVVAGETARPESLPEVVFLGEGGSYNTPLEDFIVSGGPGDYQIKPGPSYNAASGEKVWGVSDVSGNPLQIWNNSVYNLGPAFQGCVVDYRGIDDDENGIRSGFWVGSDLLEIIIEGMVFEGSFTIPHDSTQFRMVAEESIAGWYTPCEGGEPTLTPTPDATNTPTPASTPTATPTEMPEPGNSIFMPLILRPGGGPQPTPTATTAPPTATTAPPTATPTKEPIEFTVACSDVYDFEKIGDDAKFEFAAFAFIGGLPLEDVELKAELDPGNGPTKDNVEETNHNGKADFRIDVPVLSLLNPKATIRFEDQSTYGDDFCVIDFDVGAMAASAVDAADFPNPGVGTTITNLANYEGLKWPDIP